MKLIQRTESRRYPGLFIRKYSKKVFWNNLWNSDPALLESRGHVEDRNGNTVIQPFTKIFNRFENNTDISPDEDCIAVQKINGFMAAATYVPQYDTVIVSTTGSLDSDYVKIAERQIGSETLNYIKQVKNTTFLFEIADPSDPHIIPEEAGAYLIGMRDITEKKPYFTNTGKELLLDIIASQYDIKRPKWFNSKFTDIVQLANTVNHEGYVVYGQTSRTVLKIKSPYYLILKLLARKKDILSLNKQNVDEEYYPLIQHFRQDYERFNSLSEQDRLTEMRDFICKTR